MPGKIKVIFAIFAILLAAFVFLGILTAIFAKGIIVRQIENSFGLPVRLEKVSLELPLSVHLDNFALGDFAQAERISFSPNILGIFSGKIVLSGLKILHPQVHLIKYPDGSLNLPEAKSKGAAPPVILTSLFIKDGRFSYLDQGISPQGVQTILHQINLSVSKATLALWSWKINFNLSAVLADPSGKKIGDIQGGGWIDFGPQDMDAKLEMRDLEITYFAPYYGDFLSEKKLLSARLNLSSVFTAQKNNLEIASHLKLSDLVYAPEEPRQEGELPRLDLTRKALDLFTDARGNLVLDFSINTKLDQPRVSIRELKRAVLEAAARNLANQPPAELFEKIQNTIGDFKAFGKEMEKIFKGKE